MSGGWLSTINPVAKLAAVLPPVFLVMFTRDVATPAVLAAAAAVAVLTGARVTGRVVATGVGVVVLLGLWTAALFALLVREDLVAHTPIVVDGWVTVRAGAVSIGVATALRMVAAMLLALLGSLGTTTDQLASALVNQCRVPYRFAYGTVAAVQFVPHYRADLATLRAAHRARGIIDPPGLLGYLRRTGRGLVPLLAGGARRAERLSMAMDARGFGAFDRRSDRRPAVLRARDGVFVLVTWVLVAATLVVGAAAGVLRLAGDVHGYA